MLYEVFAFVLLATWLQHMMFKPRKPRKFPIWATFEIAFTGYIMSRPGLSRRIFSLVRRYGGSLFGLTSMHQVLVSLPGVDRLMSQSSHTLNAEPFQYTLLTRIFSATDTPELKAQLENSWKDLLAPIERMFLNDVGASAAIERGGIIQKGNSFVSFCADTERMRRWELCADVRIVCPDSPDKPAEVEANLQRLTCDFGACIAIPLLYGQDFLDRSSGLLSDFWKFYNIFVLLMIGVPPWAPFKMIREGVAARIRLAKALYRRIDQHSRGRPVHTNNDLSDVSETVFERSKVYDREEWSFQHRGEGDLAILWGQNANTRPILFWFLGYIYSTPGLLEEIRKETAPFIKFSLQRSFGITSMEIAALCRECPLTKSCIFETYRMTNEAASIRYVTRPITINDGAYKHKLKPGMFVTAAHSFEQRNPAVYTDPDRFIPDRFLEVDSASGRPVARYGKLRPWGTGAAMCKGRTFAEKEIVALGTAIITLWDIRPANGSWELPLMIPGTGVKKPVENIRVAIRRRVSP